MVSFPIESPARLLRFGLFEVDLERNELRKRGVRLKLQDQPLSLLRVLLEHPGVLVTRDELRARLWKPRTFVEFDHSLNTAMMRLRETLGDSSENPRFIETVPRKGYRFIAPVQDVTNVQASTEVPQSPALSIVGPQTEDPHALDRVIQHSGSTGAFVTPRQISLKTALVVGAASVCLLLSIMFLYRQRANTDLSSLKEVKSIAVLPLENLSGDSSQDYFADGMTDELIASLARISSLRVVSRTTAMDYKGSHESLEKIASELHVDAVVEGTVLRSGDRVRITAELVQVSTDRHLWADTYEGQFGDILALQNQVASAIVSQIRIKLTPQDKQTLSAARPVQSEAYEDYLKGRYYWGKRSEDALGKAIQYFQAATVKDPNYALAYAGLADCYGILGAAIVGTVPTSDVAPKAEAAAKRAVELDPALAETQTALATVLFNDDWDFRGAEAGFRRAIQLNPNYATAHQRYSLYLMAMGRTEESLAEINKARALDPLSLSTSFSLGWRLYMAGRYEEAASQLTNTIEMDPSYLLSHIVLGQCYEQEGKYAQAIAELQKASAMSPKNPLVLAALGHAYAVAGNRSGALRLLDQLKSQSAQRYVSPFYVAIVYAGLQDNQEAMDALSKGYDDRSNNMIFIDVVPQFENLRKDPRFQELRHRIGL